MNGQLSEGIGELIALWFFIMAIGTFFVAVFLKKRKDKAKFFCRKGPATQEIRQENIKNS